MQQFELDEELLSLQDTVHIPGEIPIEGENPKALERILNGKLYNSIYDGILGAFVTQFLSIDNGLTGQLSICMK